MIVLPSGALELEQVQLSDQVINYFFVEGGFFFWGGDVDYLWE
jgi:hypothetical protein